MFPYVVADIGGTNARFGLVQGKTGSQYDIDHITTLPGEKFNEFEDALEEYIGTLEVKPLGACVAIAGPIMGDQVKMTNLDWSFAQSEIKKQFAFEKFQAINDYRALALCTLKLESEDVLEVKKGNVETLGNKAVFGPGTGLGLGGLVYGQGKWLPLASEGGHINIAPSNILESEIIVAAIAEYGHVSCERFLSGPGFVNLYKLLSTVKGETAEDLSPSDITRLGLSNDNALCRETLELFCAFLGSYAGNVALLYGAKGGVYLAGGILPRFSAFLKQSQFSERFLAKGVMQKFVQDIPVYLIQNTYAAFLGAALSYEHYEAE